MSILNAVRGAFICGGIAAVAFAAQPLEAAEGDSTVCTAGAFTCCMCSINEGGNVYSCTPVYSSRNYECHAGNPGSCSAQWCIQQP